MARRRSKRRNSTAARARGRGATRRQTRTRRQSAKAKCRDAGTAFQQLVDIMAHLRGPKGCPWDREQTLASLRGFVLEESHEVIDAIDRHDLNALRGEIGDLIFEGVFLAQVCADEGHFSVADSLAAINAKLIRRHPHIFDPKGRPLATAGQVVQQWEQIKAREQAEAGERRSLLGGLPKALPSLLRAHEIGIRAAAVGFDWPTPEDVVEKIEEEVAELRRAVAGESPARREEEMGDLLFSIANLARKLGIESESALRKANQKFTERFSALEDRVHDQGRALQELTLDELEVEWQKVKTGSSR
jgi:tetrapyrrole methylase family protein/MazG family protein/ATP diphosphatase